jgi:DNA modification methylase
MKYRILEGDFFNKLAHIPPESVDLVLTSPPYYTARNYGGDALFKSPDGWKEWCVAAIVFLAYCVKPSGVIWWNTGSGYENYRKLTSIYRMVAELEEQHGIFLVDEIPWIKSSASPKHLTNRPYAGWEHNFIFSMHPKQVIYNKDAVRRPYSHATLNRMKYRMGRLSSDKDGDYGDPQANMVTPNPGGASVPNYLILPQDYSKRPHPAPMTPDLANWVIRAYSPEGGVVLDPMMGIGTTWIESAKLNRKFIGCELYNEYIEIATLSYKRLTRGDDPYNGLKKEWETLHENKD